MNTPKNTRKLRHKIYIEALKIFERGGYNGLCHTITAAALCINGKPFYKHDAAGYCQISYPEIWKHKPENTEIYGFWWSIDDRQKRIDILQQAILETDSLINKSKIL